MAQSAHSNSLFDTASIESLQDARVAIVSTEWNDKIVAALHEGCLRILRKNGATLTHDLKVPGAIELTHGCAALTQLHENRPEAIIAIGVVIRGGTPHFEYVCQSVTAGLTALNVQGPVPVIYCVLTLDNEAQAWERVGGAHGHKGEEAALAALKMIALKRSLQQTGPDFPVVII